MTRNSATDRLMIKDLRIDAISIRELWLPLLCNETLQRDAYHGIETHATSVKKNLGIEQEPWSLLSQTQNRPAFIDAKYPTKPPA